MSARVTRTKGAAANADGNDGGNEVKVSVANARRGADASSRTGRAASRMQRCSTTTGWKVSSEITHGTHQNTHTHGTERKISCAADLTAVVELHNRSEGKSQSGVTV